MKKTWELAGRIAFWAVWPALFVYLKISVRTRLLVVSGNEILLVKSWLGSGLWSLPGGGLHFKESASAGAVRELREETGIEIESRVLRFLKQQDCADYGLSYTAQVAVVVLPQKPLLRLQRFEIIDAKWFDIGNLNQLQRYQHVDDILSQRHSL